MDGNLTLLVPSLSGSVNNPYSGNLYDGSVTLLPSTVDGIIEEAQADLSLLLPSVSGTMVTGVVGDGDLTLPTLALDGVIFSGSVFDGAVTLPLAGVNTTILSDVILAGSAALPAPGVNGVMLNDSPMNGAVTLPLLTLDASFGSDGNVVLPLAAVDGAALAGVLANGAITLPAVAVSGAMYENGRLDAGIVLPTLAVSGSITSANMITGAVELLPVTLVGSVISGNVSSASITLPLFTVNAQGYANEVGSADIRLPVVSVGGVIVSSIADPVFTSIALHTRTNAVTTYANTPFNSICNFNGMTLAATSAGIVALMGDNDNGTPIDASILSGISDFGSEQKKRVIAGYVGYRAAGGMELTLITDQHHEFVYRLDPRQNGDDIHTSRVKTGRGINGRFWQWKLANRAGCAFDLNSLELETETMARRI